MTAIEPEKCPGNASKHVGDAIVSVQSAPQHASAHVSSLTTSNCQERHGEGEYNGADTIALAKSRFAETVAGTVSDLMAKGGYSRDRATALLFGKIRSDECGPSDMEVLKLMRKTGVGINDAYTVLTIARTVKRARKERGLSACNAIDELTDKLKTNLLLNNNRITEPSVSPCEKADNESIIPDIKLEKTLKGPIRQHTISASVSQGHSIAPKNQSKLSKDTKQRSQSCNPKSLMSPKKIGIKGTSRKRSFPDDLSSTPIIQSSIVKHTKDSVGSADGNATISKEAIVRTKVPASTVLRSKRGVSGVDENGDIGIQQPPMKRART
mmetsp:Transcript_44577/g.53952  ORF Transcript_44577/g.53952 Transcript_44577/m.53952 type:complete len:325 (-) Transcript_44577:344-1318(-)